MYGVINVAMEWAKKFYKSRAWLRCREGFILSVFGMCNRCSDPGHIVHHKITLTPANITDARISLNWELLEYVCLSCHNSEHMGNHMESIDDELMFDINGDVVLKK